MKLLGTTRDGETWAVGTSSAAPPSIDGQRLPYTRRGSQLVVLRHTDAGGWQVRDVLRTADGSAFDLQGGIAAPVVVGQMTPSGAAWIAVVRTRGQTNEASLFHRRPGQFGGQFRRDDEATAAVAPMLTRSTRVELQVRETPAGRIHGLLLSPGQAERRIQRPAPGGGTVEVRTQLEYGALDAATWTRKTLPLPTGYAARANDVVRLTAADATAPGQGWSAIMLERGLTRQPMIGRLADVPWEPITTGLDVLDLSDAFAFRPPVVEVGRLRADSSGVWIGTTSPTVVAFYDADSADVTRSWCTNLDRPSNGCGAPLDANHPAAMPGHIFDTARGTVALGLSTAALRRFVHGDWTEIAAPGLANSCLLGARCTCSFTLPRTRASSPTISPNET